MLSTCSTALNFIYPCFLGPFVGCQMHLPHPLAPLSRTLPSASCHVAFFHFALTIKHHLLAYIIHVFYYFTQLLSTHLWSGKRTRGSLGNTSLLDLGLSLVSMYLSILFCYSVLVRERKWIEGSLGTESSLLFVSIPRAICGRDTWRSLTFEL